MRSSKRVKLDERYDESPSSSRSSSRSGEMVPPSPSTQQLDAFLSGISSPGRPPSSVPPPPSVPGIPPSPANSIKAGIDYSQAQKPDGDLFGSKEHLMGMASSSTPGKQQSLKVTGGGKPSNSFSEKNPDCNACHTHVETRYHCSECEDFDLCVMCYREKGHKHKMEKFGFGIVEEDNQNEPQMPQNPHEARKQSIEKCIQSLVHACQCRDMTCKIESCIKMKRVIRHTRDCRLRNNGDCTICKQFVALCLFHASNCNENQCSVPLCSNIKQKLKKQRIEHQIHENRLTMRRMIEMRAHSAAPTPSTHVAPSPAPSTPRRMQQKSPSASPHPSAATSSPKPKIQQQSPGEGGGGKAMGNMQGSVGTPNPVEPVNSTPPQKPALPVSMSNSPSPAIQMQQQHPQQQQQQQQQQQHQQQLSMQNPATSMDMFGMPPTRPQQYNQLQELQQQHPQFVQQQRQPFVGTGGGAAAYPGHYANARMIQQTQQQQYHQQQQQQMYMHQQQQQQRQQQFVGGGGFQGQYGGTRMMHQSPQQYLPQQVQQQMYAQTPQGPVSNHMIHQQYHAASMHPQMVGHHGAGPPPYPGGRNPMMGQGQRMMAAGKPMLQQQQQQQQFQYMQQQQQQQHAQMQGDYMSKQEQLLKLADTL